MSCCHGCHQAYEPEAKRPRILDCGHSVCSQCLLQRHRKNSGVVPCPRCGGEEYYADLRHVPVNLDLEAMVAGLSLQEEEQEAAAAAGPSPPLREEAALPATPRVLAQSEVPFSLDFKETRTFDLPRGVEEGLDRRRSTTHLEFKTRDDFGFLEVRHLDGAGEDMFLTVWDFDFDAVTMWSHDPATLEKPGNMTVKEECGLQEYAKYQARIVEDRDQYEVFLDGVSMGCVEKDGGPSTPPAAAKIQLSTEGYTMKIYKFFVETE